MPSPGLLARRASCSNASLGVPLLSRINVVTRKKSWCSDCSAYPLLFATPSWLGQPIHESLNLPLVRRLWSGSALVCLPFPYSPASVCLFLAASFSAWRCFLTSRLDAFASASECAGEHLSTQCFSLEQCLQMELHSDSALSARLLCFSSLASVCSSPRFSVPIGRFLRIGISGAGRTKGCLAGFLLFLQSFSMTRYSLCCLKPD